MAFTLKKFFIVDKFYCDGITSNGTKCTKRPQRCYECSECTKKFCNLCIIGYDDNFNRGHCQRCYGRGAITERQMESSGVTASHPNTSLTSGQNCLETGKPKSNRSQTEDHLRKSRRQASSLSEENGSKLFNKHLEKVSQIYYDSEEDRYELSWDGAVNKMVVSKHYVEDHLLYHFPGFIQEIRNRVGEWYQKGELFQMIQLRGKTFSDEHMKKTYCDLLTIEWTHMKNNDTSNVLDISLKSEGQRSEEEGSVIKEEKIIDHIPEYYIWRWISALKRSNKESILFETLRTALKQTGQWIPIGKYPELKRPNVERKHSIPPSYCIQSSKFKDRCMMRSLINAFFYIGDVSLVTMLKTKIDYFYQAGGEAPYVLRLLNEKCGFNPRKIKVEKEDSLLFFNKRSGWPTLCILSSRNYGISHAITIVDDYIFDSTLPNAIPKSKENLHCCCSQAEPRRMYMGFEKFHLVVRFLRPYRMNFFFIKKALISAVSQLDEPADGLLKAVESHSITEAYINKNRLGEELDNIIKKSKLAHWKLKRSNKTSKITNEANATTKHIKVWITRTEYNDEFNVFVTCKGYYFDGRNEVGQAIAGTEMTEKFGVEVEETVTLYEFSRMREEHSFL